MTHLNIASLVIVGNLPDKTNFTFANSIRGAKLKFSESCEIRRVVILDTKDSLNLRIKEAK